MEQCEYSQQYNEAYVYCDTKQYKPWVGRRSRLLLLILSGFRGGAGCSSAESTVLRYAAEIWAGAYTQ